jgi:hypothetical protein
LVGVVLLYWEMAPAYDDAGMPGQLREGNVEYVAADIVEIHVDAGGAVRALHAKTAAHVIVCSELRLF